MFEATWFQAILLITAPALLCLAATGIACWIGFRRLEAVRRVTSERLDELTRRLRLIEARKPDVRMTSRVPGPFSPKPHSPGRRADCEPQGPSPTLIAIPNLAEEAQAVDPQVETDLSLRHAEVWALAETGVAPAEMRGGPASRSARSSWLSGSIARSILPRVHSTMRNLSETDEQQP